MTRSCVTVLPATNLLILSLISLFISSCVSLKRHPASGYANSSERLAPVSNTYAPPASSTLQPLNYKLMSDLGVTANALQEPEIKRKYDLQLSIKSLEKNMLNDREKKQYYSALPWFKNDTEQMEFLKQPGYEARVLWMRANHFGKRATQMDEDTTELIEKKDIALGMPQEHVRKSWGNPDVIEVAGNPLYKNERWKYRRYISSTEGFKLQKRIIYFEGGKIAGWEQVDE